MSVFGVKGLEVKRMRTSQVGVGEGYGVRLTTISSPVGEGNRESVCVGDEAAEDEQESSSTDSNHEWSRTRTTMRSYKTPVHTLTPRGRLIYEPPRFMNPYQAFQQILLTENKRHPAEGAAAAADSDDDEPQATADAGPTLCDPERTLAMSLSRIGTSTQRIIAGTLAELASLDEEEFGGPLHSVVIVGKRLHPLELEFAGRWCVGGEQGQWWKVAKDVYGCERETFD